MFSRYSEEAQKVLLNAKKEMFDLKHPYIGSEHLFLSILKNNSEVVNKLNSYKVTYNSFRKELLKVIGIGTSNNNLFLYTPLLKRIIENSIIICKEESDKEVDVYHLLLAILEEGDGVAIRILNNLDVDIDSLYEELTNKSFSKKKSKKKLLVEEIGYSLNDLVLEKRIDPVLERKEEINRIIEVLSRRCKNNPLLVGEAGVGKTAVVEELARRIVDGNVPDNLKNKKIIVIEMASLVAGTKYRGEFEERMSKIIKEIEDNKDIILFIDEIHTIIGAGGAEGAIDASNILKPALSRGKITVIGATTLDEYKNTIEKDKAFDRRFQKIDILEPSDDKLYKILYNIKNIYEDYHNVKIDDSLLKDIISLSNKYIYDKHQPDKSIDILDEVCVKCSLVSNKNDEIVNKYKNNLNKIIEDKHNAIKNHDYNKAGVLKEEESTLLRKINRLNKKIDNNSHVVTINDIKDVIYNKTKIPVHELESNYNDKKIRDVLNSKVVGQEEVVDVLVKITKRIKCGFKSSNKPLSLMFVGPTGVGKTYLAKVYNKLIFENRKIIRFDMSEFKEPHSISKLIGSPSGYVGYNDNKNRFEEVRNNPYSIILLDEIEKACSDVINLFLQILDEGKIVDSTGREIRFDNNIIIMTSNQGINVKNIGFTKDKSSIHSYLKQRFSIEFINRIDNILIFNELDYDNIKKIVKNKLLEIKDNFKSKGINIKYSKKIIDEVIEKSNYKELGARQVDKLLNSKIDDVVIDEILAGKNNILIKSLVN